MENAEGVVEGNWNGAGQRKIHRYEGSYAIAIAK
jgi:hypothetical protein